MAAVLERMLLMFSAITFILALSALRKENRRSIENRLFAMYSFGSSIWSLFFGGLLAQSNESVAYICRCIGMVGTFGSLIAMTFLLAKWTNIKGWMYRVICGFSLLGIVIFPFNIRRSSIIFHQTAYGMSYEFVRDFWSVAYSWYSVILAVNFAIMIFFTIAYGKRRMKKMGYGLLVCLVVIALGSVFDTILPAFGYAAIPGSTITQFFGVLIVYKVLLYYNSLRVSLDNMASYIYHSLDSAILVYDDNSNLIIVSDGAKKLFNFDDKVSKPKLNELVDVAPEVMNTDDNNVSIDCHMIQSSRYCNIKISHIFDDYHDLIGYIVVATDTTERENFIHELENARARADAANAAKSTFLANMSHEIRTPINTVIGMNEMIQRECEIPRIQEYAANIHSASELLLMIINDILDFSKVEAGMMEVVEVEYSLGDMIQNIVGTFSEKAHEKNLKLELDMADDAPDRLKGDVVRIRQIIGNLMSNAIKYTEKGSVTLRLTWNPVETNAVELTFTVSDTGIGIRAEDLPRLFDSFTRLEEKQIHHIEGTGLGLSIVKKMTELLGGVVKVESVFGQGSTFSVTIRQTISGSGEVGTELERKCEKPNKGMSYVPSFMAPNAHILAVDDNKMNLEVIRGLLRKTQVKLDLVLDGKACLEAVRQTKYDMILMDHMMPGMDGVETLHKLETQEENLSRNAKIIVLTANALTGARELYLQRGFADYLSKPVDSMQLEEIIKKYLPAELISTGNISGEELKDASEGRNHSELFDTVSNMMETFGIDVPSAIKYCGSIDTYIKIAGTFCEIAGEMESGLKKFRDERNFHEYKTLIHSVKSNARALGADELHALAKEQEAKCSTGDFAFIIADGERPELLMKRLEAAIQSCTDAIGIKTASEGGEQQDENAAKPKIKQPRVRTLSEAEFNRRLTHIRKQIESFEDVEAVNELKKLQRYSLDEKTAAAVKGAITQLDVYNYKGAIEELKISGEGGTV